MMETPTIKQKNLNSLSCSTNHYTDDTYSFKPRYILEETGSPSPGCAGHSKERNSFLKVSRCLFSWCFSICCYPFCGTRRGSFCILLMLTWTTFYLFQSIDIQLGRYEFAKQQSFHYFGSISEHKWQLLRKRVHKIRSEQQKSREKGSKTKEFSNPKHFYQHNYPAEFTCPHEERVGGTKGGGGKWLCDPRNIKIASIDRVKNGGNGCLIYSSSSELNDFQFEKELLHILGGSCEIHVFNPNDDGNVNVPPGINYHPWGFKSSSDTIETPNLKSIQATAMILDHEGYTVDLISLDCSGCEFDIAQDLLTHEHLGSSSFDPLVFMQMLIQVHDAGSVDNAHHFFNTIQDEGYVIFHKTMSKDGNQGEYDYGFLRLTSDFFLEVGTRT